MMLTLDDDYCDAVNGIIDTQHVNAEYAVSLTAYNFSKVFAFAGDSTITRLFCIISVIHLVILGQMYEKT